jgi:hypothetical protein
MVPLSDARSMKLVLWKSTLGTRNNFDGTGFIGVIAIVKADGVVTDTIGINLYLRVSLGFPMLNERMSYHVVNAKRNNKGYFHQTEKLSRLQKSLITSKIVSIVVNLVACFLISFHTICV